MELYLDSNDAKVRVRAGDADAPGMGAPERTAIDTSRMPTAAKLSDYGLSVAVPHCQVVLLFDRRHFAFYIHLMVH